MRLPSRRALWLLAIAVLAVSWLLLANRPSFEPGLRADIDPTPFQDARRDAIPAEQVIRRSPGNATGTDRPPNVVVILADDLGYGDPAAMPQKTPGFLVGFEAGMALDLDRVQPHGANQQTADRGGRQPGFLQGRRSSSRCRAAGRPRCW